MPTLFDVKIGDSQSAIEEEFGEDERVQVRGSGGRFFVQENTVAEDGRQLNKQTIGRGSRDVDRQIDRARSRVSERIDGIDPVTFEREIPTGRFAPEGTQPDASVPSDRGPEGRFVSGQRKPVDSFGRREDSGIFWPFHKSVPSTPQLGQTRGGTEPERFHTTEIEFGGEVVDLTERDREDLETFDKMLSRNVDAEVEAQRARGGTRPSELAQDFAQRQGAVSAEIQFRREMDQFGEW